MKLKLKYYFNHAIKNIFYIVIGLVIGVGIFRSYAWFNEPQPYVEIDSKPHFVNVDSEVIVYTTSWCVYCKKTKEYLFKHNISFTDRDIESSSEEIKSLYSGLKTKGVPQIVIGNKVINGFNEKLLEEELKIKGLLN